MRIGMLLRNVLYVSYLVPASRVRPHVPNSLPLSLVGDDHVFISLVAFRCTNVHLDPFKFPNLNYNQINIRTYVRDPQTEQHGVYFFFSGITSWFSKLATGVMGVNWEHAKLKLQIIDSGNIEQRKWQIDGYWQGDLCMKAIISANKLNGLFPFEDNETAVNYLTGPLLGFYSSKSGIKRLKIWHAIVEPYLATVDTIQLPLLESIGMVKGDEKISALYVPEAPFYIFVPPRLMSH